MSEGWDEYAEGWDNNAHVMDYSEKVFSSLSSVLDISNLRVLDFGCGTGLLTERMSPLAKEVVALDTSKKMIDVLNNKNLPNVVALSEELSETLIEENNVFTDKFDLIVASSVCSFLTDYEKTLTVIRSALKSGGIFIQWDWLSATQGADYALSIEEVKSAYNTAGLMTKFVDKSFSMEDKEGEMPVLIGIAENSTLGSTRKSD